MGTAGKLSSELARACRRAGHHSSTAHQPASTSKTPPPHRSSATLVDLYTLLLEPTSRDQDRPTGCRPRPPRRHGCGPVVAEGPHRVVARFPRAYTGTSWPALLGSSRRQWLRRIHWPIGQEDARRRASPPASRPSCQGIVEAGSKTPRNPRRPRRNPGETPPNGRVSRGPATLRLGVFSRIRARHVHSCLPARSRTRDGAASKSLAEACGAPESPGRRPWWGCLEEGSVST